jgi:hypothetical protein
MWPFWWKHLTHCAESFFSEISILTPSDTPVFCQLRYLSRKWGRIDEFECHQLDRYSRQQSLAGETSGANHPFDGGDVNWRKNWAVQKTCQAAVPLLTMQAWMRDLTTSPNP